VKIFCLEGEWAPAMTDRQSVEPLLEMLSEVEKLSYVHRRVGTRHELRRQVRNWNRSSSYTTFYLASHGARGALYLSIDEKEPLSIDELAELLEDQCSNAWVILSGCQTMLAGNRALDDFLARTGADAVCGYRSSVNWIRAAALDLLLLQALGERSDLQRRPAPDRFLRAFHKANAELAEVTGFDWYVKQGRGRDLLSSLT
jgi:hypothetical protein